MLVDEVDPLDGDAPATNRRPQLVRLVTEWSTDDHDFARTLRMIEETPVSDPVRHEMEAALHTFQARLAWREADRLRMAADQHRARQARAAAAPERTHGTCPTCAASVVVRRSDGRLRVHTPGSGGSRSMATPCEGSGATVS